METVDTCRIHTDCFANNNGKCTCLNNLKFSKDCSFYKNKVRVSTERLKSYNDLAYKGDMEKLDKYYKDGLKL